MVLHGLVGVRKGGYRPRPDGRGGVVQGGRDAFHNQARMLESSIIVVYNTCLDYGRYYYLVLAAMYHAVIRR